MSTAKAIGRLYKIAEAAEILHVSPRHIRNLISDGEIIIVATGADARGDRIEEIELQRFIMRRRVNRGISGAKECRSISAVKHGGSNSNSTTKRLDSLLGPRRKKMH